MSDQDIDAPWSWVYGPAGGNYDPLDWAVNLTKTTLDTAAEVIAARATDPWAYAVYVGNPHSTDELARKILANLLDSGWTMPAKPTQENNMIEPLTEAQLAEARAEREHEQAEHSFYRTHLQQIFHEPSDTSVDLPVVAWLSTKSAETIQVGEYQLNPFEAVTLAELLQAAAESLRSTTPVFVSPSQSRSTMIHAPLEADERTPFTERQKRLETYYARSAEELAAGVDFDDSDPA